MKTDEPPPASADSASPRRDIVSARSRMRTKYGSQRQIAQVAGLLRDDETLAMMCVAEGPSAPDRLNHGLLAVTDQRVLFVSPMGGRGALEVPLGEVSAVLWRPGERSGSLSFLGRDDTTSFTGVANPDGRDVASVVARTDPRIKRVGPR